MAAADSLANDMQNLQVTDRPSDDDLAHTIRQQWGYKLEDLYKIALKFFKEKEGKELQLKYNDKVRLVAYTKQVTHGKYTAEALPDVGFLDVVGNDRRQAWQALGDLSKTAAMTEFVQQLDTKSNLFKPYVQELRAEQRKREESAEGKKKEDDEKKRRLEEEEMMRQLEVERQRKHDQEMQIRAALNQQTSQQFRKYVYEQYPYNPQLQELMIEHLQEQHYQQYMQQVYQQQVIHQQQQYQQLQKIQQEKQSGGSSDAPLPITNGIDASGDGSGNEGDEDVGGGGDAALKAPGVVGVVDSMPPLAAASVWTRKDFKQFKDSLRKDKESVVNIGSGESLTVRVPTHEDGTCLFWEFATDHYDIGFGVYFEWTISPSNTVSVHITESSDDEEEYEEDEAVEGKGDDVEKGGKSAGDNKPPTDEIIPVYRRDCHEEVYCGSHVYPGRGVYLLKFDNSYSLWRSKTLYYRVYYSR